MKNKLKIISIEIISVIFILILNIQNIFALGITPGRITIDSNRINNTFYFTVLNSEHKDIGISISCQGDLAKNIILSDKKYYFSSNQSSKTFSFKLNFNKDFNKSKNQGKIVINELKNSGNVRMGVVMQIILKLSDSDNFNESEIKDKTSFFNILNISIILVLFIILFIIFKKIFKNKKFSYIFQRQKLYK